jgi:glucokinase
MILAGDIGGTKTVLGLFEEAGETLRAAREETFPSRSHGALEEILDRFLGSGPRPVIRVACFGVAGPVVDGRSRTTNLPWELDEVALARRVGAPRAKLLNDLEAAAYGMLFLAPGDLRTLHPGAGQSRGNIAVIAAGTGLGEAMLYWGGDRYHPIASEGGHADFAPRTDREMELLGYLRREFGHVSYERLLSGPGLFNIYRFLRDSGYAEEPAWLHEELASGDPSATITRLALADAHLLCTGSLDLFAAIYGAEAGNLALRCLAVGGVYVGGGIAPKILPKLQNGTFVRAFTEKGRFADLMRTIAVNVAVNSGAPLIGAAHYGRRLAA